MAESTPSRPADPSADPGLPFRYTAALADTIERRWQDTWDSAGAFRQPNPGEPGFDAGKPKFYCLDMFPYPSGAGLHVGHPEGYTATDIISRLKRMTGHNVLHPMGWDAFGLPAEQYAIQTGIHPAITTARAIENFKRQLRRFGFSYDWSREVSTIDPAYYRWTQWIFLKLYDAWFDPARQAARPIADLVRELESGQRPATLNPAAHEHTDAEKAAAPQAWASLGADARRRIIDSYRLAYLGETTVNWCPKLGTVLANDEVIEGKSERGGHPVVRRPLKQWMFRITAYAERLTSQLDGLDWSPSTKTMQREWIGRSEGAEIEFRLTFETQHAIIDLEQPLRVFTTRPDTLFGATYMVVAPEHPLVSSVLASDDGAIPAATRDALRAYVARAASRSDIDRQEAKEKTGVFTGFSAINPATGKAIPVWTSDYVLMGYGTGAIMAVPAHDERDAEFARAHALPIVDVVYPSPVIAARYFALHAYEHSDPDPTWREQLADMLGLATTGAPSLPHAELLEIVFNRRTRPPEPVCEVGVPGARRGGTKAVWLEFIDELGLRDFHDLRQRFASAGYHAARGDAFAEPGIAANSANAEVSLDGLHTPEAKARIIEWLARTGRGRSRVQHKLRDWTFSRQRYWGEPFPIVFDDQGRHYPVGADALPVTLPELADYMPVESDTPAALLAKATSWARTTAGAAGVSPKLLDPKTPVTRECNTMPGSAGSSWYFMRYCDAGCTDAPASGTALSYWLGGKAPGVDLYLGGSEHAVGHLLYSRFWNNVLFDLGVAPEPEPFRKLFHQGMITSFAYQRADKTLVPTDEVTEVAEGRYTETKTGQPVTQIVAKMSKSLKNVVNPDDVIVQYGADTFRLYEMYMGPLEASKPWNPRDISGLFRFLQRAWRLAVREDTGLVKAAPAPDEALDKLLHRLIVKVRADIERISLNTAIAAMIEFVNAGVSADKGQGALTRDQLGAFALVLAPFAPHMAEELWQRLGREGLASLQPWPAHDPAKLTDDSVEVPVQVAGKVRGRVMVPAGADVKAHETLALADAKVQEFIAGKPIRKIIVVPGKMVNVVV